MLELLLLAFLIGFVALLLSGDGSSTTKTLTKAAGPILLNVTGSVAASDAAAIGDAPHLATLNLGIVKGVRYDAARLRALEQGKAPPNGNEYAGPKLAALLKDAGAKSYAGVQAIGRKDRKLLAKADAEGGGWLLATHRRGVPLGEGDRGPVQLVRWDAAAGKLEEGPYGVGVLDIR